jgi:putative glutathione S-transferase
MGLLVEGVWKDQWYDTESHGGKFVRPAPAFRDWVAGDGSSGFPPERGRYHLYVSLACPWASRVLVGRKLKGLEDVIGLSVVDPYMGEMGWAFSERPGCIPDTVNGKSYLHEIYQLAKPDYTGRVIVPTLWDKERATIVNNESSDLLRMVNSEFNALAADPGLDLYPEPLRTEIDAVNERVYHAINNGVYKAGFATRQAPHEEAVRELFTALDEMEARLGQRRYLITDETPTEADWRLFTTLVRFDAVYYVHFKCNLRRIEDYPNLRGYLRDLYQAPGVAETVNMDHIKQHYYRSHPTINPYGLIPIGPELDLNAPHGRGATG